MTILKQLALYLESEGCGTTGESIFVNNMPDDVEGILLFSDPEGFRQHTDANDYYRGSMNVTVRSKSTTVGEKDSDEVFKLLRGQGMTFGSYRILISKPEMLPHSFGRNEGGYVEWLLAFQLTFVIEE